MENVQLMKDIDYPFKFGTLVICSMMCFLNCLFVKDNVVWRENMPVCKKIFNHYNSFENCQQVYESFFRKMLERFGEGVIPVPVKITKGRSSSGKAKKNQKRGSDMGDVTPLVPKSAKVEEKGKGQLVLDVEDEVSKDHASENQPKPVELVVEIAEDSDEEGALFKSKVVKIIQNEGGMQKISDIWLNGPSYEQDVIEETLRRYCVDKNIELESLQNVLPDELIECVKEAMNYVPLDIKEDIISHLKIQFRLSLSKLKNKMNVLRQCIYSSNKVLNYYLK